MSNLLKEKKDVGVIVCRMQVPYLTESHKSVIETVLLRHSKVIIFLGTTQDLIDEKNPFPFLFRKEMLYKTIPNLKLNDVTILPLPDNKDNQAWVNNLDEMIKAFLNFEEEAILYGGRDSFIPYYKKDSGQHICTELSQTDYDSGTELRKLESYKTPKYNFDSARAILWTMRQLKSRMK